MSYKNLFVTILILMSLNSFADQVGKVIGIQASVLPDWWKQSFLEIKEDSLEAGEENKHLILFFHLDNCPYCAKMANEHFTTSSYVNTIKNNFDVVELNIKGDREVTFVDNKIYTEKELAILLDIYYTPVMLFLNKNAQMVLRTDGYRDHKQFQDILSFVQYKHYQTSNLQEYLNSLKEKQKQTYSFIDEPFYEKSLDLTTAKNGLALLIVEDKTCQACTKFHQRNLKNKDTLNFLKSFKVFNLDALSNTLLTNFKGKKESIKNFVSRHKNYYRPGLLIFNQGELVANRNSWIIEFHLNNLLSYYSTGKYQTIDPITHSQQRSEELLNSGKNIDYSL